MSCFEQWTGSRKMYSYYNSVLSLNNAIKLAKKGFKERAESLTEKISIELDSLKEKRYAKLENYGLPKIDQVYAAISEIREGRLRDAEKSLNSVAKYLSSFLYAK